MLIPIQNAGQTGIVRDIPPWELPLNVWSDGNNVRAVNGAIRKAEGYSSVMATCPVAPYHVVQVVAGSTKFWVVAGLTAIHAYDMSGVEVTTALSSGIDASVTTIPVVSTAGFEDAGTITIDSETMAYTGKTSTTFTGASRASGVEHDSGAVVTRTKKWYDITRSSGAYAATAEGGWSSTILGGILILTNGVDDPQFWALTDGVPLSSTLMADLSNWPADTECEVMKAFRTFLVALNVTKSDVPYRRLVKWSTEAATQTVPGTSGWDESSSTNDAGEYELREGENIVEGLPLGDTFMIYTENSCWQMSYVGTPFIFSFRLHDATVGALTKNCVAAFSGGHFIFGNGDLFLNDGQKITSLLPHKLRDYIFTVLDGEQVDKSFVFADYAKTEMLACFVSSDSTTQQCDKAVIWNWATNAFTIRDIPGLSHIGYGVVEDETTLTSWEDATPTWSTVTGAWAMSWDQVQYVPLFASPSATKLYRDATGNKEDTANMTSFIEKTGITVDQQGQPDQSSVKHIKAIYPTMKISNSSSVNVYVGSQMSTEEAVSWSDAIAFNPDTQSKVSCRKTGKLLAVKFESTGDLDWQLNGLELEIENAGRRGSRTY